ncbi:MAG: TatD family hydrolase [Patescibacteria group bacterium]|nr:TatD family hydrolase [Patescibacteria group bacterium]
MSVPKLFDTHAHLNFEAFQADWQNVAEDCRRRGVWVVSVGSQFPTSRQAVDVAEHTGDGFFAAVGVHPIHAHEAAHAFDYKKYSDLIRSSKIIVGIGETGLDFFHDEKTYAVQREAFVQQIHLAKEFDLPLIIHGRNRVDSTASCYQEIFNIVQSERVTRAVVHCFGGNREEAKAFLELGFFIGITGIVTFRNARTLQAMVSADIPLERLLIETDAPYLAPDPHRGQRNQPQYVEYVARKIAELKELSYEEVAVATTANARRFYRV